MERHLAHIERVTNIREIAGCDNICQCTVLGWNVIIAKKDFKENDLCVYIEIDSIVPQNNAAFSFLEKRNYKIKTLKMRGTISQGLAMPLTILPQNEEYKVGDDVTATLGIEKVQDEVLAKRVDNISLLKQRKKKLMSSPIIKYFMRYGWFRKLVTRLFIPKTGGSNFPSFIVKTDETRLQNNPNLIEYLEKESLIVTEKLDGTSTTFFVKKKNKFFSEFGICSRNRKLTSQGSEFYGEMANKYNIEFCLKDIQKSFKLNSVVLQGETIGEGIQKNKYKIEGKQFYAFNLIFNGVRLNSVCAKELLETYGINFVPILDTDFKIKSSVDEMIKYADGESVLCNVPREGLVIRSNSSTASFKCISNAFLLHHDL